MSRPRPVDLARLVLGIAAVAKPGLLLRLSAGDGPLERGSVRILGARYVVQSTAGLALDRPRVHQIDAAVDLIHASTMLALAVFVPSHRRLAIVSVVTATVFAVADLNDTRRSGPTTTRLKKGPTT